MSDPSPSSVSQLALLHTHHTPPPAAGIATPSPTGVASPVVARDYRKGNWTLHETLILITAKRLDDDRRAGGGGPASPPAPRSAEQRWKWVENYCWNNGCLRSQNQCNDKWDNLLRDYKKVRDYESRTTTATATSSSSTTAVLPSYWTMERHERKERNLPTNLAPEVFEALTDVLSRRAARRTGAAVTPPPPPPPLALPPPPPASPPPKPLFPPPPPVATAPSVSGMVAEEASGSSESGEDGSGGEPEAKRRRLNQLGSSVVRSATLLARTLVACEEKRERRHRELLELEERRLRLEEERTEVRRQGFAGLISAVNNLSGAIHALVSDHRSGDSSR